MKRKISSPTMAAIVAAVALSCGTQAEGQVKPKDAEVQRFVAKLLSEMSSEEKIGQLEQAAGQYTSKAQADELTRKGQIGSFLFLTDPERINELQRIAVTQSPHHIPLLFGYDVIHGFRTINPIPLALASSWDPALVESVQAMAAREASAAGVNWAFSPMVDIARDPRWGRIMESAGEDPYLGEQMAAAQVRGFQGAYVGAPHHVLASVKHLGGYGAAPGGRDYESVDLSDELLHNVYLRPYRAAIDAGAATVMSAYMDLNGVPASGNRWLLHDLLRDEWGFKGFVVSDWDAVKSLTVHGYTANASDAALRAFDAGVNMEMTSALYRAQLPALLSAGRIDRTKLDEAVRPILEMKYRLGLFTDPYVSLDRYKTETLSIAQREGARHAAEQSAILLRNEGGILPLSKSTKTIALIGPLADSKVDTLGSWSLHATPADTVTLAEGLKAKLPNTTILTTKGVEIQRGNASIFDEQAPEPKPTLLTDDARNAEFAHAIDLVKQADVAILVLGEAQNMNGERASRANLTLPGKQQQLLEAAVATGKPIVLVLMTGRPLDITWASEHVPAILNLWYPGTEGGNAAANLLFGDAAPSGKLTVSWPRSVGQLPLFYSANLTQIPESPDTRYWDESSAPLYPFGFGLSYTRFTLDNLQIDKSTLHPGEALKARVTVKNQGAVAGDEVVQLYTHQRAGSNSRPVRELKAFAKIHLAAGETRSVDLMLPASALTYWSSATKTFTLEPGAFDLWVGDSSTASLHKDFAVAP
ncbi:beta-glucosidase [Granulicella rosea]|uniref:beta-glucosidase n=1 Tax=Granulicella rosea TaxID=474952 RepID=A0A239EH27_9BACT|nr:beta-glucosidase BglX [Granulicella rosea]SNS43192.1 beta-glucosidase [Granulicella rosea]